MNIDDIIENAQLKGRIIALDAQVFTLKAEVSCLEAAVRSHERVDCLMVTNLKAEVARLDSLIANSEHETARKIHGLQQDNETLQHRVDFLEG